MDEEKITIEELQVNEIGRLFEELSNKNPGGDEYNSILNEIIKLQDKLNESNKISQAYYDTDQRKEADERKIEIEEKKLHQQEVAELNKQYATTTEMNQRKLESILKGIGFGVNLLTTTALAWVTLKYNIKLGPISSKEAWQQIFRKKM